jgi:hypothetical protein
MIGAFWAGLYKRRAAASVGDTQTVTTGADGTAGAGDRRRGFISGAIGSVTDGTSNIYGGAAVTNIYWDEGDTFGEPSYVLTITGATDSGWTTLTIGGTETLYRIDATFGSGTWLWPTVDSASTQAFGLAGSVKACVFS